MILLFIFQWLWSQVIIQDQKRNGIRWGSEIQFLCVRWTRQMNKRQKPFQTTVEHTHTHRCIQHVLYTSIPVSVIAFYAFTFIWMSLVCHYRERNSLFCISHLCLLSSPCRLSQLFPHREVATFSVSQYISIYFKNLKKAMGAFCCL